MPNGVADGSGASRRRFFLEDRIPLGSAVPVAADGNPVAGCGSPTGPAVSWAFSGGYLSVLSALADRIRAIHNSSGSTLASSNGSSSDGAAETVAAHLARALDHHRAGRMAEAELAYREAIRLDPDSSAVAYNNLGTLCRARGGTDEALDLYRKAALLIPDYSAPYRNMGLLFESCERYDEALLAFHRAIERDPGAVENLFRAGVVAARLQHDDKALDFFRRTVAIAPSHAEAWFNAAVLLSKARDFSEAEAGYRRALELRPRFVPAATGLAALLMRQRRIAQAEVLLREILTWQADHPPALGYLASICAQGQRLAEAEVLYRKALTLDPKSTDVLFGLAQAVHLQGRQEESVAILEAAGSESDRALRLRYALPLFRLPTAYRDKEHIDRVRASYRSEIAALAAEAAEAPASREKIAEWAGDLYPFNLAYQQANDRDLQEIMGRMTVAAMAERHPGFALPVPMPGRDASGRIRMGVACGFFRIHTVWKLFRGWFRRIDRSRFETFAYQTGRLRDMLTREIDEMFDHVVDVHDLPMDAAAQRIRADGLHLLFYPEIGMDPVSVRLAALRLAPVQCLSFGHPDTTGMKTLDYFVSAALMEPDDADSHYTETLIRLPGIGLCYDSLPLQRTPFDLGAHGIDAEDFLYLCCQNHMKYLPQYDGVLPAIAAAVPRAKFVFLDPGGALQLRRRLGQAFAAAGVPADRHLIFLPKLSQDRFLGLNEASHVFLDSIGWSGGNTTFEALLSGLPVVTLPTGLMRGRVSHALLTAMDMPETIARSLDDYVAIAVRLGRDPVWRAACARKVVERRPRVLGDVSTLRAFEDFVVWAVERAGIAPVNRP